MLFFRSPLRTVNRRTLFVFCERTLRFCLVAVWGIRIHERIVCERGAEPKADNEAVQLRDRIQLALRVKDFIKQAPLFIGQGVFYVRQVIRNVDSQLVRAAAGFYRPRLGINVAEEKVFKEIHFFTPPFRGFVGSFAFSMFL